MYKLLIVDDERIAANALHILLRDGCPRLEEIREAYDGLEAVETAADFRPDIVIMDIRLPVFDGIEASRRIRGFLPECKIVLLTAFGEFGYAKAAISIGVEEFIVKPAEDAHVLGTVNKILDNLDAFREKNAEDTSSPEQAMRLLEHMMIVSIICNNVGSKELDEFFLTIGSVPKCMLAVVAEIRTPGNNSENYQQTLIRRIIEAIKAILEKYHYESFATNIEKTIYIFALCEGICDPNEKPVSKEVLNAEIENTVKSIANPSCTVGICGFKQKELMYESFLQAGRQCHMSQEEVRYQNAKEDIHSLKAYPIDKEEALIRSVLACKKSEAFACADELFDWMRRTISSFDQFRLRAYELIIILYRRCGKEYAMAQERADESFNTLRMFQSEIEVRNYVKSLIDKLIGEIGGRETNRVQSLIYQICAYIQENYRKPLTLDEMADMAELNKYYFSKSFKKVTNQNFIDYVADVRLAKAKELLKDPTIHVRDIGFFVGYEDAYYFSKVFKNKFGMTPTAYRKKILKHPDL